MDRFQNHNMHDTEAICTGVGWVWLVTRSKSISFVAEALPKSERVGNETVDPEQLLVDG